MKDKSRLRSPCVPQIISQDIALSSRVCAQRNGDFFCVRRDTWSTPQSITSFGAEPPVELALVRRFESLVRERGLMGPVIDGDGTGRVPSKRTRRRNRPKRSIRRRWSPPFAKSPKRCQTWVFQQTPKRTSHRAWSKPEVRYTLRTNTATRLTSRSWMRSARSTKHSLPSFVIAKRTFRTPSIS